MGQRRRHRRGSSQTELGRPAMRRGEAQPRTSKPVPVSRGKLERYVHGRCSAQVDECSSSYCCQLWPVFGSVAATPGDQASGASTGGTGGDRRRCAPPAGRALRAPCRCGRRPRRTPPPRQSAPAPTQAPRPTGNTPRGAAKPGRCRRRLRLSLRQRPRLEEIDRTEIRPHVNRCVGNDPTGNAGRASGHDDCVPVQVS
jgi:hypothetical protein